MLAQPDGAVKIAIGNGLKFTGYIRTKAIKSTQLDGMIPLIIRGKGLQLLGMAHQQSKSSRFSEKV